MDSTTEGNQLSAERSEYYSQIQKHSMAPLWENLNHLLTPEPEVKSVLISGTIVNCAPFFLSRRTSSLPQKQNAAS